MTKQNSSDIFAELKNVLATLPFHLSDIEKYSLSTEIRNLPGWDSFKHLTYLMAIEERFDIEIGPEEFREIGTFSDLVDYVERATG
ncbi:MAG: acyl carrier protein [Candidatus Hydrogenedentota bacterium]|nr:MAG: acyl carrier protein [Candidatus Hydrogenedentota bacterium]